ncbi:molybdopterin biosynthesis protein [Methanosalsum natronophilum]|uniref:molybdopterin biosynthesis protein n=1 Tax=Methanosalsum natronophilum TaxID=768733 RepID=UPI0021696DFC|nr:molybdopterin biosynthesis protein [Methanosalsum natronophilum]MCS3924390.1 putative molybdopterin biosynthesis protein [Methanosalsum natronophilum]
MQRKEFRNLITVDEAKNLFLNLGCSYTSCPILIENSEGSILNEDISSIINVPPFDKSLMDGFAVKARDTYKSSESSPIKLKLVYPSVEPGTIPKNEISTGEAVEISTGAAIPEGSDAVVMVEYTHVEGDYLYVYRPVYQKENVMSVGSDILRGQKLVKLGEKIRQRDIGLLAATGKREVNVRKLNVGIISTGDELVNPGQILSMGQIYDTNSYSLYSAVKEVGGTPHMYGTVKDDWLEMRSILKKAVDECELVLTSGSTSAGSGDIMYRIIGEEGDILAHGINIMPGKPVVIGKIGEKVVIGLPGNPTSALMIFKEFVAPFIKKSLGDMKSYKIDRIVAFAGSSIRSGGRHQLLPVGIIRDKLYPADKGSGAITTLSQADGFIEVNAETEHIHMGEKLEVTLFDTSEKPDLLIAGGLCQGLDILEKLTGLNLRIINSSSSGGFSSISTGTADVGCVNMPFESGYNVEMMQQMGLYDSVLVKGYRRSQGLIVKPSSTIYSIEDLPNKRFSNRNGGSGTRKLFDICVKNFSLNNGLDFHSFLNSIIGYDSESKSALESCNLVLDDSVDATFAPKYIADDLGLRYVPIAEEEFDFVIPKKLLKTPEVDKIIKYLNSDEFGHSLPEGLYTYKRTGEIIDIFEEDSSKNVII